jgi:tetratricopeptide (TPR) repeat protein
MRYHGAGWLLAALAGVALGGAAARAQDAVLWRKCAEGAKRAYQVKDYDQAEKLLQWALQEAEKFGAADPRLAVTLHNLANLYATQARYADAEPLYQRALGILEKARGPEHPEVAMALVGLADFYAAQAKYANAEPPYQRAVAALEKTLGPDHKLVAVALERYARLLHKTNRDAEAGPLEARAQTIRAKQVAEGPAR